MVEPASVGVIVEEHPELDNPRGKAEGRVEAAVLHLSEAHDAMVRLAPKLERAELVVDVCRGQVADAEAEVVRCEREVAEARVALEALTESEG